MSFEELEFIANGVRDEWTMPAIAPRLGPAVPILIREFEQDSYSVVLTRITGPSVLPVSQSTTQNLVAGIDQLLRERVQVLLDGELAEQISATLRKEVPHSAKVRASHETIYRTRYGQSEAGRPRSCAGNPLTGEPVKLTHVRITERESRGRSTSPTSLPMSPIEAFPAARRMI
ncbi:MULTISPECIES: hypothetical protein [unclassified Rhodococcus (in: high G+C Gram-positive bacteria)]|uniref:hypothetical protein n=1 Tax=unclassified Rhodococcus (in: high G+C Gram-positive bacteria) TaxID=192944 RepID=UPI000B9B8015|nr:MULTISPECIES: hypothetical protein [unclassified Rhodococcus (in: high G+C Gram-positive bacteria)]OZE37537.1 hypothetical protein CH259_11840 [Rhodococcus sp. 05-2254-4]OZE40669.1 hypothetical protein CH261_26805 [Rhodococcus sp. 05-2254-3]OZE45661.1 hypothetical protein CH283_25460 [Rhodococcus sp. 05-2254-2]